MNGSIAGSLLTWAIEKHRADVENLPVISLMSGAARKNDKRPARLDMHVPDEWVKNIAGDEALRDVYVITRVPREHFEEWHREASQQSQPSSSSS